MGWWKELQEQHAPPDEIIEKALWQTAHTWDEESSPELLLAQYTRYLEMADAVSERRATANTFFLTLNTGMVTAIATFGDLLILGSAYLWIVLLALMNLCVAWMFLLRSYRTLNRAKFKVVGMLEQRLPASPFWSAEWQALKEGKDWLVHVPLTPLETLVPLVFIALYGALGFLAVVP
jgi:hypothetical protein